MTIKGCRRKGLTHGQACVALIVGIFHQVFQLYALQKFAATTDILKVIFPNVAPNAYFDDRLGDTLDALYDAGLGDLEQTITRHMLKEFTITVPSAHSDTATASVYGAYAGQSSQDDGISMMFGYSKKHRADLKQLVWSLSVSSDSAFPLFQQAYDGNAADVDTYLEQWQHLIDLLGHREFLFVATRPSPLIGGSRRLFYRESLIPFRIVNPEGSEKLLNLKERNPKLKD